MYFLKVFIPSYRSDDISTSFPCDLLVSLFLYYLCYEFLLTNYVLQLLLFPLIFMLTSTQTQGAKIGHSNINAQIQFSFIFADCLICVSTDLKKQSYSQQVGERVGNVYNNNIFMSISLVK